MLASRGASRHIRPICDIIVKVYLDYFATLAFEVSVFGATVIRIIELLSDLLDHYVVLDSMHNFLLVGVLVSRQFDRIFVLLSLFPLDYLLLLLEGHLLLFDLLVSKVLKSMSCF